MRLDRFLSKHSTHSNKTIRLKLATGAVELAGFPVADGAITVDEFSPVILDGQSLQQREPLYLMLHKPTGCVSATKDLQHRTVVDLLDHPRKSKLHIAGRLDFNTTGLLLLTNHGSWSKRLTLKHSGLAKVYRVTTEHPIPESAISRFADGFYFATENITTLPAKLEILTSHSARLTLVEGRYHQVKRMFGRLNNKVLALHRDSMAGIALDPALQPGEWRALTAGEIARVKPAAI